MTAPVNPYQSPGARVADVKEDRYSEVRILSTNGRLGRLRYIAYSLGLSILVSLAFELALLFVAPSPESVAAAALSGLSYAFILALTIVLTIQRAHDFNTTGWLSILALIPLVNLIFWFIPGTNGENRFGHPTPPNSVMVIIAASIVPIVTVVGILAAIAIPAYQQYSQRAGSSQTR